MSQPLNFQSLEDFVQREPDDISTIHLWYEKLSEYELDGSESQKDVDTLVYALRYLMNYTFTAAEELKEVAEQEAVVMAEREEKWEEQRQLMREEIEELRQRITVRADASESSEAFLAQIDSLKEENRILQQLSRDRDMEMADQRDRFESLVARADQLTRERDALMDHRVQMEDTIRELNRRISSKSEEVTNEWETKKLKLRNEQAVTLSKQMQAVVAQNDQLRTEVERVSDALEDATRLIEDSSQRIAELSDQLKISQKNESQLHSEGKALREKLEVATRTLDEMEAKAMDADEILKRKIQQQADVIGELQQKLYESQVEIEEMRGRIRADTTEEKEAELEKLKQELITATKMARSLLGQETSSKGEPTETTDWPRRLMQAEHRLLEAQNKIDAMKAAAHELEDTIVMKEVSTRDMAAELEKMREAKFGSAREEMENLLTQVKIRDDQISRLTRHCTLLQIELGRYAEGEKTLIKHNGHLKEPIKEEFQGKVDPSTSSRRPVVEDIEPIPEDREIQLKQEPGLLEEKEVQTIFVTPDKPKETIRSRGECEQQAMIIAGLNFELMMLLEELEIKNTQMVEMEHSLQESKRRADEGKVKLKLAYEEVATLRLKENIDTDSGEENRAEIMELRRMAETIRLGGSEMERRTEEVTRKLITAKVETLRLSRLEKTLRSRFTRATDAAKRLRERLVQSRQQTGRQLARVQYELDITCYELASVQNKLLHSVSLKQFEELSKKYRELLKKETIGGGTVEDSPSVEFDIVHVDLEENPSELAAKNKYLKKIVDILTEQNEFWSNETDILQKENEEMKKFMEDLENESDVNGVLVSVESRLIETIRELSQIAKEQSKEHKKMRDAEETLARHKITWHVERKHFVHIVSMLQQAYQVQRNNNMATITVAQMEALRAKIVEVGEDVTNAKDQRDKAEKVREQLEHQLIQAKGQKKAIELIESEGGNRQRLEKALRDAFAAERIQTAKAERLQNLLKTRERLETQRSEELEELRKNNEELLFLVGNKVQTIKIREEKAPKVTEMPREVEKEPESEYEMDFDSSASTSSSSSSRIVVKTSSEDHYKDYERRLAQIKETAETVIRSYKDQLAHKDAAIESYRELLLTKINEVSVAPKEKIIIKEEKRIVDEEMEERLRSTMHENARLKEEVEELEAANRNLYRERRKSVIPTVNQIGTQTEDDDRSTVANSPAPIRGAITPIPEETERSQFSDQMDVQKSEKSAEMRHRNEIRRLQERIKILSVTNKNLMIACEKIKEEAIIQLSAKRKRDEGRSEEINAHSEVELVKLRSELRSVRLRLKESQEKVETLTKTVETTKKNAQEEVWKWEQRKKTEESIAVLKKKLKSAEQREEDLNSRLERREKRLEEMGLEAEERRKEVEKIRRQLADNKAEKEKVQKESQHMAVLREKQAVLEKRVIEREREVTVIRSKLQTYEHKNRELSIEVNSLKKSVETRRTETKVVEKRVVIKEDGAVQKEQFEEQSREMKKKLRLAELRLVEAQERLELLEKDLAKSQSDCERLMKRLSIREDSSSGAVAVLSDKLNAKDREISQLKTRIVQLERRLSQ